MPLLADLQTGVRRAVVEGDQSAVAPLLRGGADPRKRLAIHHRHYTTSLVTALVDRFPATVWLIGSAPVMDAARAFVERHPPTRPCIAEYGDRFPAFLETRLGATIPYLGEFAQLEWHLSRLALAIDQPPVSDLSAVDAARIADSPLVFQPGVHYLRLGWGLDGLVSLYLSDTQPESYAIELHETWLELRGARGELRMNRLTRGTFVFRAALLAGGTLGDAAVAALEADPDFDPGTALMAILSEGLVAGIGGAGGVRSTR